MIAGPDKIEKTNKREHTRKLQPKTALRSVLDHARNLKEQILARVSQAHQKGQSGIKELAQGTMTEPPSRTEQKRIDVVESQPQVPVPHENVGIDPIKAEAWIMEEPDRDLQRVRREIVEAIHPVSFEKFNGKLHQVVQNAVGSLQENSEPYSILWDYKAHGSKRWVTELSQDILSNFPPTTSTYLFTSPEVALGLPTVRGMLDQGINTFLIIDDAIYSGEQVLNKIVGPIVNLIHSPNFSQVYPDRKIKIVLAVPYIANGFLQNSYVQELIRSGVLEITPGYEEMPTLNGTLSEESLQTIKHFDDRISSNLDSDTFYMPPVYIFDHRVPDAHSFPEELRSILANKPAKPYGDPSTVYYQRDDTDFQEYAKPIMAEREAQRATVR